MSEDWKSWSRNDIIYGVIAPLCVVLLIVGLSQISMFLGRESFGIVIGIINEIEEMLVIVAVPLLLGLLWNRWAGGASGFLMGSLYALWFAVRYGAFPRNITVAPSQASFGIIYGFGPTLLGYVLSAMLIGYVAGALNKRSENFLRMLISSVVATTVAGIFLFWIFQLSPMNVIKGLDGFLLTVLSRVACGVLTPVVAKIFMWYGQTPTAKNVANLPNEQIVHHIPLKKGLEEKSVYKKGK